MSGDLLTLRMMVVSAASAVERQWREGAALASVPIEFRAERASEALAPLKKGGFDIVIVDAALPVEARSGVISAARLAKPMPLIVLAASEEAEGADLAMPQLASAEETKTAVERCIRLRLPKRVLIVDDSRTMRGIVRKILAASRFTLELTDAEDGADALKKLANGYDVVLLDCNMPGINGFDTLTEIQQAAPRAAVIMMTSTEDEALAGRAQASGAAAFLRKPFYPADIDALLTRIYSETK